MKKRYKTIVTHEPVHRTHGKTYVAVVKDIPYPETQVDRIIKQTQKKLLRGGK